MKRLIAYLLFHPDRHRHRDRDYKSISRKIIKGSSRLARNKLNQRDFNRWFKQGRPDHIMVEDGTNGKSGRETISGSIKPRHQSLGKARGSSSFKRGIYRNCFGFKQLPTRGASFNPGSGEDTSTRIPNLAGTTTRESSSD